MAYNFKDLKRRTYADKRLKDKAFKIGSDPTYNGYERSLASMVYKFFDKKSKGAGIKENQQLELRTWKFINQLLGNLKRERCILPIKKLFGVWI